MASPKADSVISDRVEAKEVTKVTAWNQARLSEFDFRSDIITAASEKQLRAILSAGLNDGWHGDGARAFEKTMAVLTGREAALLVTSSTMGNQASIRTHLHRPPNGIVCDVRSHLIHQENGSIGWLSGALALTITPRNGMYLTVEDIKRHVVLSDGRDSCTCPTRLIHLENPLGGIVMPLTELRRIYAFARESGLVVHMDGARLWEAVAAGHGSLQDFCSSVDSVNLCLTKGLGASAGSVVVGDTAFIRHLKWVRKSLGGGIRQPGLIAAAANAAVEEIFGSDASGKDAVGLRRSHRYAQRLAATWVGLGGRLTVPQQTNMLWLDLNSLGIDEEDWERQAAEQHGLELHSSRIVTHHQISEAAVARLESFMAAMIRTATPNNALIDTVPRNEAVSRLAACMEQTAATATKSKNSLVQHLSEAK